MNILSELLEDCDVATTTHKPSLDLLGMARELKALGFTKIAKEINTGILRDERRHYLLGVKSLAGSKPPPPEGCWTSRG